MASKEEYFSGPRCKNINITIEGPTDGDVPISSVMMILLKESYAS